MEQMFLNAWQDYYKNNSEDGWKMKSNLFQTEVEINSYQPVCPIRTFLRFLQNKNHKHTKYLWTES